ncbi:hypothetical protein PPACK8108_LOCUS21668 [Phakopsora pachyrhizi]|uniref:Uncharacterized protein n=1 Tax=Phakopsora pachyrhizi TaxID=170000 RepID=A0AAV0BI87_PHAPC|nr:hypothetical protein PPACK8108_LOCUS21668 [Phakopsora pachyrhizi]
MAWCGGLEQFCLLHLLQHFSDTNSAKNLEQQTQQWGAITAAIEHFNLASSQLLGALMQVMAKSPSATISKKIHIWLHSSLDLSPPHTSNLVLQTIHLEWNQAQHLENSIANPTFVNSTQSVHPSSRRSAMSQNSNTPKRKSKVFGMVHFSKWKVDPLFYQQEQKIVPNYHTGCYEYTNPAYEHTLVILSSLPTNKQLLEKHGSICKVCDRDGHWYIQCPIYEKMYGQWKQVIRTKKWRQMIKRFGFTPADEICMQQDKNCDSLPLSTNPKDPKMLRQALGMGGLVLYGLRPEYSGVVYYPVEEFKRYKTHLYLNLTFEIGSRGQVGC